MAAHSVAATPPPKHHSYPFVNFPLKINEIRRLSESPSYFINIYIKKPFPYSSVSARAGLSRFPRSVLPVRRDRKTDPTDKCFNVEFLPLMSFFTVKFIDNLPEK